MRSRAQNGIPETVGACPLRAGLHAAEGSDWWAPHVSAGSAVAASESASEAVQVAEFEVERWVMLGVVVIVDEQADNPALD